MTMDKSERRERLLAIMQEHKLKGPDVGAILDRTAQTVRVWRSRHEERTIPVDALKLLEAQAPKYKKPTRTRKQRKTIKA